MTNQQAVKLINAELKANGPRGVIKRFWYNISHDAANNKDGHAKIRCINIFKRGLQLHRLLPEQVLQNILYEDALSFYWRDTPEGHEYWYDVRRKLLKQ